MWIGSAARTFGGALLTLCIGGMLAATLVRYAPGFDVDERELDHHFAQESLQSIRADRGSFKGALELYAAYLKKLAAGDLGNSLTSGRPTLEVIRERLPATAGPVSLALLSSWTAGMGVACLSVGLQSARITSVLQLLSSALLCMPASAIVLLFFLSSDSFDNKSAIAAASIALVVFPRFLLNARALLSKTAGMPHVAMARARGIRAAKVMADHICRPTLRPLAALAGATFPLAVSTAVPVEVVCDLPGIGQLGWQAAQQRDWPVLLSLTLLILMVTVTVTSLGALLTGKAPGGSRV